jgi:hypothetical protein
VSRIFGLILLLVIVAAAGLFYAAPIISFYDVRSACKSQDIASLAKLIDFDSVRTSLKAQLVAGDEGISAPAPSALNDPVGATGSAFKGVADSVGKAFNELVNPNAVKTPPKPVIDVNTYLTPKALLGLTYGAAKDANTFELSKFEGKPPAPKTAFFSLERARLTVTDGLRGTTTFTFERRGMTHWNLVHIGLPTPDMEPKPETPAG